MSTRFIRSVIGFIVAVVTTAWLPVPHRALGNEDPPAVPTGKPLTEKDYEEFGHKLEKAVAEGDKTAIDRLFSIIEMLDRKSRALGLPEEDRKMLLKGAQPKASAFADQILAEVKKGGRYTFLRTHEVNGQRRTLMRFLLPNDAVNYHDFLLERTDGRVAATDFYNFSSGELLSHTLNRMMVSFLVDPKDPKQGLIGRLSESDQLYAKNYESVRKITAAIRGGRGETALAEFRKLPAELQKDKFLQLLAIKAAQDGDEAEYLKELDRFRKAHPRDPAVDLVSIDYFILKKQYDDALSAVKRLEKAVGGDPFLTVQRAAVLKMAGRFAEAKAAVEGGVRADPKVMLGYWIRLDIALTEKNHADTLTWLKKIEESGIDGISIENIQKDEDYAAFAKSPEFKQLKKWMEERKK